MKLRNVFKQSRFVKLFYQGNEIVNLSEKDFKNPVNSLNILIDKTVMEIFINEGEHYIVRKLNDAADQTNLNFESDSAQIDIKNLKAYMKSVWDGL